MAGRFYQLVVDSRDPAALARFWAAALDLEILYETSDEVIIGRDPHDYPGICFVPVGDRKLGKNRLHIDIDPDDQDAEVDRLLALGARRIDIGQGAASWVVLADPEGNEFDVLTPHRSLVE
ncbi:MAG: VOC family protein [Trebonia sp.]